MTAPATSSRPPAATARPPLVIAHVGPPESLDASAAVYRTVQPCRALGELPDVAVVSGSSLSPALYATGLLFAADILVVRDVGDPDLLPIIAARRRQGRLSVFEIGSHPLAAQTPDDAPGGSVDLVARSLVPQLARQSDCVQFVAPALEAAFRTVSTRRVTFPTCLWDAPPQPASPRPDYPDKPIIGWAGARAHRRDLESVLPALAGVLDRHPEVSVAIMGEPGMQACLGALPPTRVSFSAAGALASYYQFLDGVDIGVAPLLPTAYNRCRSDIRFVEYAAHGVLAVCADLEPFRDVVRPGWNGFLFRDAGELETVLERLLAESDARKAIAERAARYVAAERLERPRAATRLGFYLATAAQLGMRFGTGPAGGFPPVELLEERQAARRFPGSRYVALGAGQIERLLGEGLRLAAAGAPDEAQRCFEAAERLAPKSHLPPLLLGAVAPTAVAIEALGRAAARNPLSCRAAYLLGVRLGERGDHSGAVAAFERARVIAPGFGAPQERLGAFAEAAGRLDDACRLYEDAALNNSAFALPIARLAAIAHRAGKLDKAVGLLERSLGDDPDLPLTNYLVGCAFVELGRYHQARVHLLRAVDGASDRAAVLTALAKAELGLGNVDAARISLESARPAGPA